MVKVQDVVAVDGVARRRKPRPGDTRWDGQAWRRWDGRRWSPARYSLHPERLLRPEGYRHEAEVSQDRRRRALVRAMEEQVMTYAATVVYDGGTHVVLGHRRHVSHVFHAVLTLVTGGLWAVVWLAVFLSGRQDRVRLEIDRWGNVWAQQVASAPV